MRYLRVVFALAAVAAGAAGCSGGGDLCSASALTRALAEARPGDTVRLGACRVEGSFTVPTGVTLQGAGVGETVLASSGDDPVLWLEPATSTTTVRDLSVDAQGRAGIVSLAEGGEVVVERVEVTADHFVAAGFEGLSSLVVRGLRLVGPVTPDNVGAIIGDAGDEVAGWGLVVSGVESAELTDVDATGFSLYGALLVDSVTTWRGGSASANLGVGLMAQGGSVDMEGVSLDHTLRGSSSIAFGGVFYDTTVMTSGLEVSDNESYGLLSDSSTVEHVDLHAAANDWVALWSQNGPSFTLRGPGTLLEGNRLAGVVVAETDETLVAEGRIASTRGATKTIDERHAVRVGDGVHLLGLGGAVTLRGLALEGNERVGAFVDLAGGDTAALTLEDVSVAGTEDELGVVAQGGEALEGWDEGVERDETTEANDASLTTTLDALPGALPTSERPDTIIGDAGLVAGIIGDAG